MFLLRVVNVLHLSYNSPFNGCAWLPTLWMGVRQRMTLLWYKCSCFLNRNHLITLKRYWSPWQQGHLLPHSNSKTWYKYTTVKWPITYYLYNHLSLICPSFQEICYAEMSSFLGAFFAVFFLFQRQLSFLTLSLPSSQWKFSLWSAIHFL